MLEFLPTREPTLELRIQTHPSISLPHFYGKYMKNQHFLLVSFCFLLILTVLVTAQPGAAFVQPGISSRIPVDPTGEPEDRLNDSPAIKFNNTLAQARISAKIYAGLPGYSSTAFPVGLDTPANNPLGWQMTFSDEFNGTTLDLDKWATEYGYDTECIVSNPPPPGETPYCNRSNNDEKEWYIDSSPRLENGVLKLVAQKNDCSGDNLPDRSYAPYSCENFPYTSGMISTHNRFSQLYGFFEARMKLPKGQGFWPAFWLIPQLPPANSPAEVYWPPEIDIMENKGQEIRNIYMTNIFSGVYPEPGSKLNDWSVGGYDASVFSGQDFSIDFHTFAVEWQPGSITWYVDGVERNQVANNLPPGEVNLPDFPGDMQVILNLAIGGNFVDFKLPTDASLPNSLDIDYVRVYKKVTNGNIINFYLPHIAKTTE